ncbi:MAG: glycosyltransferase [Tannerellaceae bacterium]|jgi:glycosyltransferase involved in cell wall biosynthesis|nr:glycosyltransferase [Tannerellaceae bacterium]
MWDNQLVSIIMPCYNSVKYIAESILSVINQTYNEWELIIVDDCSNDGSDKVILDFCKRYDKIEYFKTDKQSGSASVPRNIGLTKAKGRYIALLDSQDLWIENKLEEQIKLFEEDNVAIVYSNFEKIDEGGQRNNRIIISSAETNYKQLLKVNSINSLTVIYDAQKSEKTIFPEITNGEDYALWLSILKKGFIAKNTNTIMALNRITENSLSTNKLRAIKCRWRIYRDIEKVPLLRALYYMIHYAYHGFIRAMI